MRKVAFYILAKRFVAGETIEDAVKKAKELHIQGGVYPIVNILGEHVQDRKKVIEFRRKYLTLIWLLAKEGLTCAHISIKPSQLGICISRAFYRNNLAIVLTAAKNYLPDGLVEIDAEEKPFSYSVKDVSLELARRFSNQRLCRQANLEDTEVQIISLKEAGVSIRLCKGAYPGDIRREKDIRNRFLKITEMLALPGNRAAFATHDLYLIDKLIETKDVELQVLLGLENELAFQLAKQGWKVGIYIPCGQDWLPFAKRRWKTVFKIILRNCWYRLKYKATLLPLFLFV